MGEVLPDEAFAGRRARRANGLPLGKTEKGGIEKDVMAQPKRIKTMYRLWKCVEYRTEAFVEQCMKGALFLALGRCLEEGDQIGRASCRERV